MAQRNTNPNGTTNLNGWTKTGSGTMTSTTDGVRVVVASGQAIDIQVQTSAFSANTAWLSGMYIRRNTAASVNRITVDLARNGVGRPTTLYVPGLNLEGTSLPLNSFVRHGNLQKDTNYSGSVTAEVLIAIAGPADLTIKGIGVYDTQPTDISLDSNDTGFSVAQADDSYAATFAYTGDNDEQVGGHTFVWGDGTTNSYQAVWGTNSALNKSHSFPATGLYSVTQWAHPEYWVDTAHPELDPRAWSLTKTVMVPVGPFVADFTNSSSYLNVAVNAGASVAPSKDPVDVYTWNWGDGTPNSTGLTSTHTYETPGTYTITLTTRTNETLRTSTKSKQVVAELPSNPSESYAASVAHSLFAIRLSAWDGNTYMGELPAPLELAVAVPANDMASFTLSYPLLELGGTLANALLTNEYDLGVEVFNPTTGVWVEPRGCRFIAKDDQFDYTNPNAVLRISGTMVVDDLTGMLLSDQTLEQSGRTLRSSDGALTAGRVMNTLLGTEQTFYGGLLNWNFTTTQDSSGAAWPKQLTGPMVIPSNQTHMQVLEALTDMGMCSWTTQGNELLLFSEASTSYARNYAYGGVNDVYLLAGRELSSMVTKRTRGDYLSTLFIPSGAGFYTRESTPVSRRGKRAQRVSSSNDINAGDANILADGVFATAAKLRRSEYTCDLNLSQLIGEGVFLPFIHYAPGDSVWAIGPGGYPVAMTVQQITLTQTAGETVSGSVVLADRLLTRQVRQAKQSANALGGASRSVLGNGSTSSAPETNSAPQKLSGISAGVAWADGWSQFDTGTNALNYKRIGNMSTLSGVIRRTGAAQSVTTAAINLLTITSAVYQAPTLSQSSYTVSSAGQNFRLIFNPDGQVQLQKAPVGNFTAASGEYFAFSISWISG